MNEAANGMNSGDSVTEQAPNRAKDGVRPALRPNR